MAPRAAALLPSAWAAAAADPYPDTAVPGAGYRSGGAGGCGACFVPGQVNLALTAKVCEYTIKNVAAGGSGAPASFVLRTWVDGETGECGDKPLGPTWTLRPGDAVNVLVRNNISQDGWFADPLGPPPVIPDEYLQYVQDSGRYAAMQKCSAGPLRFYGSPPPCGDGSNVSAGECRPNGLTDAGFKVNWENMPHRFDDTNLHFHGMHVVTHLFHPQGTSDPEADFITILPPSDPAHNERGCYCYKIFLPPDHPTGTYWYHTHRHRSTAVQAWSGMAGMIRVVDEEKGQDAELAEYGVAGEIPFVIWDPHMQLREEAGGTARHAVRPMSGVDEFLMDQTEQSLVYFLVNDEQAPDFRVRPMEAWRVRILCATTENLATFRIVDAANNSVPFWGIASDGIGFTRAYEKGFMLLAGGQREDIIVQFPAPGTYRVRMDGIEFVQFFCTGSANSTLATFTVAGDPAPPATAPAAMAFTPGMPASMWPAAGEIATRRTVTLNVFANRGVAPFPQFSINQNSYAVDRIDEFVHLGDVEEWVLINPDNTWHPFHIHVNPFVVVDVRSAWPYDEPFTDILGNRHGPYGAEAYRYATHQLPARRWRDTTFLPPFSVVKVWMRFAASIAPSRQADGFVGKSVMHCHFLAHEDTGMMANILITQRDAACRPLNQWNQTWQRPGSGGCYGYPDDVPPAAPTWPPTPAPPPTPPPAPPEPTPPPAPPTPAPPTPAPPTRQLRGAPPPR